MGGLMIVGGTLVGFFYGGELGLSSCSSFFENLGCRETLIMAFWLLQLFFSGHNFNTLLSVIKLGLNFYFFRSQIIIGVAKINLTNLLLVSA